MLSSGTLFVFVGRLVIPAFKDFVLAASAHGEEVCTAQMAVQIAPSPCAETARGYVPVTTACTTILLIEINTP